MTAPGGLEIGRGFGSISANTTKFEEALSRVERRLRGATNTLKGFAVAGLKPAFGQARPAGSRLGMRRSHRSP